MHHFGHRIGLGMDGAGLLELQCRFLGDGKGGSAPQNKQRACTAREIP